MPVSTGESQANDLWELPRPQKANARGFRKTGEPVCPGIALGVYRYYVLYVVNQYV